MLGLISGNVAPREVVVIAGHHDHLGEQGNEIYNGAVDNCTGVATRWLSNAHRFEGLSSGEPVGWGCLLFGGWNGGPVRKQGGLA